MKNRPTITNERMYHPISGRLINKLIEGLQAEIELFTAASHDSLDPKIKESYEGRIEGIKTAIRLIRETDMEARYSSEAEDLKVDECAEYVINNDCISIDFDLAVSLMDDEIREDVHEKFSPCSKQKFFEQYYLAHKVKYGEIFELAKANPQV